MLIAKTGEMFVILLILMRNRLSAALVRICPAAKLRGGALVNKDVNPYHGQQVATVVGHFPGRWVCGYPYEEKGVAFPRLQYTLPPKSSPLFQLRVHLITFGISCLCFPSTVPPLSVSD